MKTILALCVFVSLSVNALAADEKEKSTVAVFTFKDKNPEKCPATAAEFLKKNSIPELNSDGTSIAKQLCAEISPTAVLVKKKAEPEPTFKDDFSIDIAGGYTAGNAETANGGGRVNYKAVWKDKCEIDTIFKGEYRLDADDNTYHLFEVSTNFTYNLTSRWALFVFGSAGRDTRKALAFVSRETAGVTYTVVNNKERSLKISVGVGHQYQDLMSGALEGRDAYANNVGFVSYRVRYEEQLVKDQLSFIAGALFQHVLYAPSAGETGPRYFDTSDYRFVGEVILRVKLANLGKNVKMYGNLEGNYEYNVTYFGVSPYDLLIKGGVGLSW